MRWPPARYKTARGSNCRIVIRVLACPAWTRAVASAGMTLMPALDNSVRRATDLRHRLHQIPEIGYEEFKTAAAIRAELDALGISHVDGVPDAPTATVAWLGNSSGPCVALRADIDALPILERTGLAYASTHAGLMHACGHDGHTATLLGAAATLKKIE